jgi:NAD(P)-dependent dehydrogenase (short-subunit alcohol dehydrogenase family)
MNILVAGGNGGIGRALLESLSERFPNAALHGTFLTQKPEDLPMVDWHQLDVGEPEAVKDLASRMDRCDWLINAVGFLHTDDKGPEKALRSIEADFMLEHFRVNTLPTLLLAQAFQKILRQSDSPKFVVLSARVGSISDNALGGWYSYRMSKAALNMAIKTLAIEWQRTIPKMVVAGLHPGTVDTGLSKPFQANVAAEKLFTPRQSADYLIEVLENLQPENSGGLFAWDGRQIPF